MKKVFSILSFVLIIFTSCNPSAGLEPINEAVKLKATISNTNEIVILGDTLKIILKLPDDIISNSGTFAVQSLQMGQFYLKIQKIDTVNKKSDLVPQSTYWATQGIISITNSFSYSMNINSKPYGVAINFKPAEKGLYFLEVLSQVGNLKINNTYDAKLYINFDVLNKHYNLLNLIAPYFGGQPFYDALIKKDADGFGNYFFRVE